MTNLTLDPGYSFCEPVSATSRAIWHIRDRDGDGIHLGGGVKTEALCGRDMSWDVQPMQCPATDVCPACLVRYKEIKQEKPNG